MRYERFIGGSVGVFYRIIPNAVAYIDVYTGHLRVDHHYANVDDDNGTPSSLRATWLSWQPTAPPASTFAVPSYCTCTQ